VTDAFAGPPTPNFLPGAKPLRTICGFWRRILAFGIDGLLVGLFGIILGLFFSGFFERLGNRGPLLGFFISLAYFGIFNSSKGDGQTPGKRFLQIRVVDREGKTISVRDSLARSAILGAPWFLGSNLLPQSLQDSWFGTGVGFLFSGVAVAIIYLYVFNSATRQSLHDLIVGTFVVESASSGRVEVTPIWRAHVYIAAASAMIVLLGGPLAAKRFSEAGPFPELLSIQRAVGQMDNVASVSVATNRQFGSATSTTLIVTVQWNPPPGEEEKAVAQVAARVLATDPRAASYDFLSVRRMTGYNIGIAHSTRTYYFNFTPAQWQQKIRDASIKA
jgi:uncharacterized RDD family membrane protein YckC